MRLPQFAGGHTEVVVHLLEANGDVNQGKHDNSTPLYIASQNHHTDVVQLLLEARADTNAQNDGGATALFISCQSLGRVLLDPAFCNFVCLYI